MRKLDLTDYTFSLRNPKGEYQFVTYGVRTTIVGIITHPNLQMNDYEMLEIDPLADKIENAKNNEVLLTEGEYRQIMGQFRKFRGFGNNDRPLLKRLRDCPELPTEILKLSEN